MLAGLSWRWIFVLSIPFGIYSFVAGRIALRDQAERDCWVDIPSCALSALGIGLVVVSLDGFAHRVNSILSGAGIAIGIAQAKLAVDSVRQSLDADRHQYFAARPMH